MTVEINTVRKAVEFSWDTELVQGGRCSMRAENVETGGASTNASMPNDGFAVLTYPLAYKGETLVTVEGDEGGEDSGTLMIGGYIPDPDEPGGGEGEGEPGPEHPIFLPPYPDIGGPGEQPYPDQGLPGEQPHPDHELPGDQPRPDHELPGRGSAGGEHPDNTLPEEGGEGGEPGSGDIGEASPKKK